MGEIYMMGCTHSNGQGPKYLREVLDLVKPTLILNEASAIRAEDQLIARECARQLFSKRKVNAAVAAKYLKYQSINGYEHRTAQAYADRHDGVSQDFLNDSVVRQTREYFKMLFERDVADLKKDPQIVFSRIEAALEDERRLLIGFANSVIPQLGGDEEGAFRSLERKSGHVTALDDPAIVGSRDSIMARSLREAHDRLGEDAIIVTITGIGHLIRTRLERTFYSKVQDLDPKRVFLLDSVFYEGE